MKALLSALRITPLLAVVAMTAASPVLAQNDDDLELISAGSEWKYDDSGEDLGTAWRGIDYDDSDWSTGKAPLGYGDADLGTEISFGENSAKFITQYFRKEFTAENPDQYYGFTLRVQRDDGIAVYLNDSPLPVLLDNLPLDPAFDTVAESSVDGSRETVWIETSQLVGSLVSGRNVIAVEVHQSSPTSSDTRFDCELLLSTTLANYGEVRVGIQTQFNEGGSGITSFARNPLANPPEFEMNWMSQTLGGGFALTTEIPNENGNPDIQFALWDATLKWESELIDTRNYRNVRVRVNVRTNDLDPDGGLGNAFETSDYFQGDIDISTNGVNFDIVDKWLHLAAGNEQPIDWSEVINSETARTVIIPISETEPGTEWMKPDFDDSGWISGTMGVGFYSPGGSFEDFVGINVTEEMQGTNSACYIRIPFTVTELESYTEAQLRVRYDDGYAAFINGAQVADSNAPAPLTWNAEATASHRDLLAVVFVDTDILEGAAIGDVLNEGENILTIVGMNASVGDSDFLNDVVLRLGKPGHPVSLDALNFGAENRKTTFESPVGLIPDRVASIRIRFEAKVNGGTGEVIYFDDVQILGDPIVADHYIAYMFLETEWELGDPRMEPDADPDGDTIPNLLEYAFGSRPQVASLTTTVNGEEVPILPVWDISPSGVASVSYRQISAPLAPDGDNAAAEGFHVQDIRYVAQISRGDLDGMGEMIWHDGTQGGESVFEQRVPFEENEDGTVQVRLAGLRELSGESETYVRLLVHIAGFD
ncbi:MAG: hypothetical protein ACI9R3_000048 [Verrucomicrobiales bacterium]|jgi:hypothetical protein